MAKTDYDWVPLADTTNDLLARGDYVKAVYTGYRPFIPLSQRYNMTIEPKEDDESGFFAFQPEGWNITNIAPWKAKAEVGWGKPHTDGRPGRIEAYNIVRTAMGKKPLDTAEAMALAGGSLGTQAATKAVKTAQMLEQLTEFIGVSGDKEITKESTGEVRTAAYVNTITSKIGGVKPTRLVEELKAGKDIAKSYESMLGKNEAFGGFSPKGFDIGNTTDIDVQTLSYILQRLQKDYGFGNITNIVGAEETNIKGHKLFQAALKNLDTNQAQAAQDISSEIDKVMGKVERVLKKNFKQAEMDSETINKLSKTVSSTEYAEGGNEFVLDGAMNLINVTSPENTKEVWNNLTDAFAVAGHKKTKPAHEDITMFSAQILDRLVKSYTINSTRQIDPNNGGYIYFMPANIKGVGSTLLAIVIRGTFVKKGKDTFLADITNEVFDLHTFSLGSQAMIDNWLHYDLTNKLGISEKMSAKIRTVYQAYAGQQMQMYSDVANSVGSLILHKTSLTGLGWGTSPFGVNTSITLTSLLTSGEMAKNIQAQITEQLNSPKTTTKFKKMYEQLVKDSDDLTKSWKKKVGMKPPKNFTKDSKGTLNFSSALEVGPKHSIISQGAQSYHVGQGSPGVWPDAGLGGFKSPDGNKLEGYAFTPFVDSQQGASILHMQTPHSAHALFKASKSGKKLESFIKRKMRWETGLDDKLTNLNKSIEGFSEILSSSNLGEVQQILGSAGIGGASKNPLLKILWQNKADGLQQQFIDDGKIGVLVDQSDRDKHVARYMRILDQLSTNPEVAGVAAEMRAELQKIIDDNAKK